MDQLAVVIVNWNRYAETARCVADLLDWRSPPEIWVVDNASSDGSASRLRAGFPSIHTLVASENLGYGGANNLALSEIDARYALLLNNDAGLEEAAARALCRALDTSPDLAIVVPVDPSQQIHLDHHGVESNALGDRHGHQEGQEGRGS